MDHFDNHFKVYLDNTLRLVQTMTIKSRKQASDVNEWVLSRTGKLESVDLNRPDTWKYYLNISGEYHVTDKPIYIVSVDTIERILFSKENLREHRNTAIAYRYGTSKYEELISLYPEQETLIKGILNPCNIDEAIQAKDGTILSYDKRFVEVNEYTLMEKVQEFIYGHFFRWYQPQYNIDNRYYNMVFMGTLYPKIVEAILGFRLEATFSNEAHSYHYKQYLSSHGFLDAFLDQMTLKQIIRFYKNIRWVEKYIGHRDTQRWLIRNVMTERNLPISEYNFAQNDSNVLNDPLLRVTPEFKKRSLNGLEQVDDKIHSLSLSRLMDKQDPLTQYNPIEREDEEVRAYSTLTRSKNATLKTKALESKVIDYSGSERFKLNEMLMDIWIDAVHRKLYRAYILINHPKSGEVIPLTGEQALLLYTLAVSKLNGITDDCIPDYTVGLSPRENKPSHQEIRSVIPDNTVVSDKWIEFLRSEFTALRRFISTVDFYEQVEHQFNTANKLINLAIKDEHIDAKAYKEVSVYQLYQTKVVSFRNPNRMTFTEFLKEIAFDISRINRDEWDKLAKDIWLKATGLDNVRKQSLSDMHRAMVLLMTKLSSYSVHYLREINDQPIIPLKTTHLRLDGSGTSGRAGYHISTGIHSVEFMPSAVVNGGYFDTGVYLETEIDEGSVGHIHPHFETGLRLFNESQRVEVPLFIRTGLELTSELIENDPIELPPPPDLPDISGNFQEDVLDGLDYKNCEKGIVDVPINPELGNGIEEEFLFLDGFGGVIEIETEI